MDGSSGAADEHFDYFISRTGANNAFAIWLRALLVAQGKRVVLQDTDFESRNFLDAMLDYLPRCERVIAIYSPEYFNSSYCEFEWRSALGSDLQMRNRDKRLMPLMLEACAPHKAIQFLAYKPLMDVRRRNDAGLLAREILAWLGVPVLTLDGVPPLPDGILRGRKPIVDRHNIYAQPDFVGREDLLAEIARRIGPEATALGNASRTGISGLGGVGKTTLARRFAWDFQDKYEGVWWVRADTIDNVHADLGRLGAELSEGLKALAVTNPEKAARDTLDWLEQAPLERPWLIVYDNAEAGIKDLHTLMPSRNAHVLVTTRAEKLYGVATPIDVDVLPPEAAADVLLTRTGREGEAQRTAAARLAEALDHLPLALDHAAAFCAGSDMSFDDYRDNLGALLHERPADDRYPESVYRTFTLAIDKAAAQCHESETLMSWLAFLAPDDIPLSLFGENVMPVVDLRKAVAALARVSLIDKGTGDAADTVSVHRLVQVVMRARLAGENKAEAVAATVTQIVQRAYSHAETFTGLAFNARWLPHGLAVIDHAPHEGDAANSTLWTLLQIGDMRVRLDDLATASACYQRALDLARSVSTTKPDSTQWQRDLSVSYNNVADVLVAQGNLPAALDSFKASHAIFERLAKDDPKNAEWQRDLSVSYNKVGDILVAQGNLPAALGSFNASLAIRERLAKDAPKNAEWQRDLSVSHIKVGDVLVAQGNLPAALDSFKASLAIAERLAKDDPRNAGWQRDLSVSYEKVGDVLFAQGNLPAALDSFKASLAIRERLAKDDPKNAGWQRDLSVSYGKVGDVLVAQGNLPAALDSFKASLTIAERLAKDDPKNAGWQRDLSVSYERVGDVLVAQGNLPAALDSFNASLAIRERLAKDDPKNAEWQRNLSVSYIKVGNVLVAQGNLASALDSFNGSLAIAERLAKDDPKNAGWQRDVAVSHAKLASLHRKAGDVASALSSIREGHAIMTRMVVLSPDHAEWKRDLAWFDGQIAALEKDATSISNASPAEAKPRAGAFPAAHEDPGSTRSDVPSDRSAGDAETMGTPTEQTPASPAEGPVSDPPGLTPSQEVSDGVRPGGSDTHATASPPEATPPSRPAGLRYRWSSD